VPNNVEAGHENYPNPMRKKTVGNGDQLDSEMATFASRLGVP